MVKLPTTPMKVKVTTISAGTRLSGSTIRQRIRGAPAPTSRAASISSSEMASSPDPSISTANGMLAQTWPMMIPLGW
jgi:hypothetical protein